MTERVKRNFESSTHIDFLLFTSFPLDNQRGHWESACCAVFPHEGAMRCPEGLPVSALDCIGLLSRTA